MLSKEEIFQNLAEVKEKIAAAAKRAGRNPEDVKLVAVSKTYPVEAIEYAMEEGTVIFGENKVQELTGKIDYFEAKNCQNEWHLIGHLQTNKCKYIVGRTALIHSVDSFKLAEAIDKEAAKKDVICDILIELNIGDEDSKFGCRPEDCEALVRDISILKNVRVKGLMCVAPFVENPEENRMFFRQMKNLTVDIANKNIDNVSMCEISMGMTGDYEVAIEEGATIVRVGTGIFGKRNYMI
ncbi:MAG: YggS family pyridoxal phosphate-dependent enzyme [Lachnospiraceae bacterium]|nr:YggS family pyridoxal phosphate-dependent enzyme [Lachnospiraceae bacterium]